MNSETYNKILRILAIVSSVAMLWISAQFSVAGFNIVVPDKLYMGWILACVVIVVEMIWNKVGISGGWTIFSAGLLCYLYGIYTNVTGVMSSADIVNAQGTGEVFAAVVLGLFLEIVPEPLFVWGLVGIASDPIGNIMNANKSTDIRSDYASRLAAQRRKTAGKNRFFDLDEVFPHAKR